MSTLNQYQWKHLLEWFKNLPEEERHKLIEIDLNPIFFKDFLKDRQTIENK